MMSNMTKVADTNERSDEGFAINARVNCCVLESIDFEGYAKDKAFKTIFVFHGSSHEGVHKYAENRLEPYQVYFTKASFILF